MFVPSRTLTFRFLILILCSSHLLSVREISRKSLKNRRNLRSKVQKFSPPLKSLPKNRTKNVLSEAKILEKQTIRILNELDSLNPGDFERRLARIAIPRRVGSVGHKLVRKFIEQSLQNVSRQWTLREDRFWVHSSSGKIRFRNIVATFEPEICQRDKLINPNVKRIVLACHYDSLSTSLVKETERNAHTSRRRSRRFVGAIDAAVPCTVLLDLAQLLTPRLARYHQKTSTKYPRLTLQLIFFDGEEALTSGNTASLFGSQHLAKIWDGFNANRSFVLPQPPLSVCDNELVDTRLQMAQLQSSLYRNDRIALFILLDLIGVRGTKFYNTNPATTGIFFNLAAIEKRILALLNMTTSGVRQFQTNPPVLLSLVRDDHQPFFIRGVPTMALIPHPFPTVWHRHSDNLRSLDMAAIERFRATLAVFLAQQFRAEPQQQTNGTIKVMSLASLSADIT